MPAKAGIHDLSSSQQRKSWIPAFAGMTEGTVGRSIFTATGIKHRTNQYLNNRIEQDHRGIKGRYGPMRGFKSHESPSRFCRCFDELRNHLQARSRRSRNLPTNARRHRFVTRGIIALRIMEAA